MNTLLLNADGAPKSILPRISTLPWQDSVWSVLTGETSVVAEYETWEVHSPRLTIKVPSVVMMTSYIKPRYFAPFSKENLKLRDGYRCQYCHDDFPSNLLTLDHVHPKSLGGLITWENIVAACGPCNNRRGANTRIQPNKKPWKPTYWELVEKRKQYPIWVPHESWVDYIDWDKDLIKISRQVI